MQELVNLQAVLYEKRRFEIQWSMSALLAPLDGKFALDTEYA